MRFLSSATLLLFISICTHADELKFSEKEYSFDSRVPVSVLDLPVPGSTTTKRVCFGRFVRATGERPGVAIPTDDSNCTEVREFGGSETAYVTSGFFEGAVDKLVPGEMVRVRIQSKNWEAAYFPSVIHREIMKDTAGKSVYAKVCAVSVTPVNRVEDVDKPLKYLFCRTAGSAKAPVRNAQGEFERNKDKTVKMEEVTTCPLPAKCMSSEWAIKPTLEIMPDSDDDLTPHATGTRRQNVHE